jgi:hypothetical protein
LNSVSLDTIDKGQNFENFRIDLGNTSKVSRQRQVKKSRIVVTAILISNDGLRSLDFSGHF